ncbi:MAG TPA: alpha-ribazole phosphatase [Syntrophomonas sp.]|nr:alpha-ribazole phosphatase [Syntrophomonas sp.]
MKVLLLRHGQTEWNVQHKYQGQTDIELNENGREQAAKVGRYLRENENIEAIYCSDLSRSRETAELIGHELQLPIRIDKRLRERGFGHWEGMTYEEVCRLYPQEAESWQKDSMIGKVPGGESVVEILDRSLPLLDELAQKHRGTVLVVSHGGLIKTVLNHLHGNDEWDIYLLPSSISSLEWDGTKYVPQVIGFLLPDEA